MTEPEWTGFLRMVIHPDLDLDWQLDAIQAMAEFQLHASDADAAVYDWCEEAGETDTPYLLWVIFVWKSVRTMNATLAEAVAKGARELRRADKSLE